MADDVKIQLGIDVEALKRSAADATNILSQSFQRGLQLDANLLGSGVPATQLPQQGGKDSLRGVIDALERIERTLTTGFMSISGGVWLSGGSGSGGPPRGPDGRFLPQGDGDDASKNAGSKNRYLTVGNVAGGIGAAGAYASSGGSSQGMAQLAGSIGSMLVPELAPIINAVTSVASSGFDKRDLFREAALHRFQVGRRKGINVDDEDEGGPFGKDFEGARRGLGFGIGEFSDLYAHSAKQGVFDKGDPQQNVMFDLMRAERGFGNSGSMANMLGAAGRTGSGGDSDKVIGAAFSAAMQEGLTKGRVGEIYDKLADAIDKNTMATTDVSATANRFLVISQMGTQFRGDTAASREMDQSIKGLAAGETGYTQMTAMLAAGFGSGKTYSQAKLALDLGVDTEGGVKSKALQEQNYRQFDDEYASADDAGRSAILLELSQMTHQRMGALKAIMDERVAGKTKTVDATAGYQAFGELSHAPSALLRPRVTAAVGEDTWRFGIGDTSDAEGGEPVATPFSIVQSAMTPPQSTAGGAQSNETQSAMTPPQSTAGGAQSNEDFLKAYVPSGGAFQVSRPAGTANGSPTNFHPGIDITNIPPGAPIHSPVDGKITNSKTGTGNEVGFEIEILGDDGKIYFFDHLVPVNKQALVAGRSVYKGQLLGKKATNKEFAPGIPSHVHFGMRSPGRKPLDPAKEAASLQSILDPVPGRPGIEVSPSGIPLDDSPAGRAEASRLKQIDDVVHRVEVHITHDNTGRPQAHVKGPGPTAVASSGQPNGAKR